MAAEIILDTLQSLGITVELIGPDRLRFRPASRIPADLIPRIREAKDEILKALANRPVPIPECEPIIPSRADCGCPGPVCRRCWLCPEHCHCLPVGTCWHCRGEGRCACTACWKRSAGETAQCVVCEGTGKLPGRVQ